MSAYFGAIARSRTGWMRIACLSAALVAAAPAARAQNFFGLFDPPEQSPHQIVRGLEDDGYRFRGPLMRRGDVYVADVVGAEGDRQRLVIDSRSGRIVERFAQRGWRDRPTWRERDLADGWGAPPRPPVGMDPRPSRDPFADDDLDVAPPRRPSPDRDVARGDDPSPPTVLYGDHGASNGVIDGERPKTLDATKSKPHIAKHKLAPPTATASREGKTDTSAAPAPDARADAAPTATEAPKPAAVAPAPTPPSAPVEVAKPPVETPKPDVAAAKPIEAQKPAAEAPKPALEAAKPPVETPKPEVEASKPADAPKPVAAVAPAPKPKAKAINDLPVNPLD